MYYVILYLYKRPTVICEVTAYGDAAARRSEATVATVRQQGPPVGHRARWHMDDNLGLGTRGFVAAKPLRAWRASVARRQKAFAVVPGKLRPVSYTHLTLPTIYSV